MSLSISKNIFNLFIVVLLTGCAVQRDNMKISQTFFDARPKVVITQTQNWEKATFYKLGKQGLLDIVINNMITNTLQESLENYNIQPALDEYYYPPFESEFSKYTEVSTDKSLLSGIELEKNSTDDPMLAPYNFTVIRNRTNADYGFILHCHQLGAEREYDGFIPKGAPMPVTSIVIYLVNLKNNSLAGYYATKITLPTNGEWDNPPDFCELRKTIADTTRMALSHAHYHFFGYSTINPAKR